jgi:hypothetical protein
MQEQKKIDNRKGEFGDYTVVGFKYQDACGQTGWPVTSWQTGFDPVHDFWVSGRNFHPVSLHFFYKGTAVNFIEIYDPPIATGIDQAEREAVLKAIAEWEKPERLSVSERP